MRFFCCGRSRAEDTEPKSQSPARPFSDQPISVSRLRRGAAAESLDDAIEEEAQDEFLAFGLLEFAKVVLGNFGASLPISIWTRRPICTPCSRTFRSQAHSFGARYLRRWYRCRSGQAAFARHRRNGRAGSSLLAHPLFGSSLSRLRQFSSPCRRQCRGSIENLAGELASWLRALGRRAAIGGDLCRPQPLISAPAAEFREPWARSLESALHDEVTA